MEDAMATTTMPGHHEHLEPVRGDEGHAVAPPRPDDILFGPAGEEIKTLIASGDKDAARALFRRLTGADEREAEDLITRLDMQINPQAYPEVTGAARVAAAPGGGRGVLAIIGLVIAVLVLLAIVQAS
jgi:hypothetical protein